MLDKAKAEIDHLAHFTVDWREIRRGRAIVEIEFTFRPKSAPAQLTAMEGDRPEATAPSSVAQASPSTPAPALPAPTRAPTKKPASVDATLRFPTGSLLYGAEPFGEIAKTHGGGWARDIIADAYRREMGGRLANLTGVNLIKSWTGFCQAFAARRGRP